VTVAEDLQGHLQAVEVVDRQQDVLPLKSQTLQIGWGLPTLPEPESQP
jgi:hypothetical protein